MLNCDCKTGSHPNLYPLKSESTLYKGLARVLQVMFLWFRDMALQKAKAFEFYKYHEPAE